MNRQQKIAFVAIPLVGALLLAVLALTRKGSEEVAGGSRSASRPVPAYSSARMEAAPAPASPEKIAKATDTVRIRGTYQNFRRAVATNDPELQRVLLPALLKDRQAALQCAEEDLARASTEMDRTVAKKVGEALRN